MSQVNVINVIVNQAKSPFSSPVSFEIFFEALQPLKHGKHPLLLSHFLIPNHFSLVALTWRIVYIGQAADSQYDQSLEEAEMDDIQPGQMRFVFEVSLISVDNVFLYRVQLQMLLDFPR
jgi:hypothetical protein